MDGLFAFGEMQQVLHVRTAFPGKPHPFVFDLFFTKKVRYNGKAFAITQATKDGAEIRNYIIGFEIGQAFEIGEPEIL